MENDFFDNIFTPEMRKKMDADIEKEREEATKKRMAMLKNLSPKEVAALIQTEEEGDDESTKEDKARIIKIIQGEIDDTEKWAENKMNRVTKENKTIEGILDQLGKENVMFMIRMRSYWHLMPPQYSYIIEDIRFTPLSEYFKYYMGYGKDREGYEKRVEEMTEEQIQELKGKIELARNLIERPLLALKNEEKLQEFKKGKEKGYEDVVSDAIPGSIQWHVSRREQGIPRKEGGEY